GWLRCDGNEDGRQRRACYPSLSRRDRRNNESKRLGERKSRQGRCGFVLVDPGSAPGRRVSRPRCGTAGFASALAYAFRAAGLGIEKSQREVRRVLEKTGSTHRSR